MTVDTVDRLKNAVASKQMIERKIESAQEELEVKKRNINEAVTDVAAELVVHLGHLPVWGYHDVNQGNVTGLTYVEAKGKAHGYPVFLVIPVDHAKVPRSHGGDKNNA